MENLKLYLSLKSIVSAKFGWYVWLFYYIIYATWTDIEVFLTVQSPSGYVYPIVSRSNATQRNSDALHRILILHLAYQACSSTGSQFKVAPVVPDMLSMPGVLHHPPMPISPWAPRHGHVPLITELAALCSRAGIHWLCPICQSAFGEHKPILPSTAPLPSSPFNSGSPLIPSSPPLSMPI